MYACEQLVQWDVLSASDESDEDTYLFAKALFDRREYVRCASILDTAFSTDGKGGAQHRPYPSKPLFLRCYALYLVRSTLRSVYITLVA